MKDNSSKDENKDVTDGLCPHSAEDQRGGGKESRSNAHIPFGSPLAQHQPYLHYMHGYPFGQGYDPSHPGYRGMSSVMMQNYPGKINYSLTCVYLFTNLSSHRIINGEQCSRNQSIWSPLNFQGLICQRDILSLLMGVKWAMRMERSLAPVPRSAASLLQSPKPWTYCINTPTSTRVNPQPSPTSPLMKESEEQEIGKERGREKQIDLARLPLNA